MLSPESCPHSIVEGDAMRYLRTGDIQDRPGYECLLRRRGEACTPEWNVCARIERVKEMCPHCFSYGQAVRLWHDTETGELQCPRCEADFLSILDRDLEWAEMQARIYAPRPEGVEKCMME
jgi:hypothetical protein